ncbi:MAG: hypothetical protein ACOYZ6_05120 [Chloroflexota bacterium]
MVFTKEASDAIRAKQRKRFKVHNIFESAAALRDQLYELKAIFADEENLKPWERLKLLAGE